MKKLFVFFTLVLFAFAIEAQTVKTFAGAASDTLTASVAKTYVIPIGSNVPHDFVISVFTDHISGTDTYTAKLEFSLDGVNYHALLSAPNNVKAAASDNAWAWSNINTYSYLAAASDTTLGGDAKYYQVYVDTPLFAKYFKVTLTATSATQKEKIYGYYLIKPKE